MHRDWNGDTAKDKRKTGHAQVFKTVKDKDLVDKDIFKPGARGHSRIRTCWRKYRRGLWAWYLASAAPTKKRN
jgi:hypothetical protein